MKRYTLIVVFNTGTYHQTQSDGRTATEAINNLMQKYIDGYGFDMNGIVSITVAEIRELKN